VLGQLHNPVYAFAAGVVGFAGATAPDWLEIPWAGFFGTRHSIIPHRTWTHWLFLWVCLLGLSVGHPLLAETVAGAMLMAFCLGGLTHLIMDLPNPMGIPILHPNRRRSLKLWASGKNEIALVLLTWVIGFGSIVVAI
jgi:hypothetical protein